MQRLYSRYSLAQRLERWQQEERRHLLPQHRQSLAYKEIRRVKVDCSFLPDSRWGVLGQNPSFPAWVLYMEMQISPSEDCALSSATVEVSFERHISDSPEGSVQEGVTSARLGPIISDHFGPRKIDTHVLRAYNVGFSGDVSLNQWTQETIPTSRIDRTSGSYNQSCVHDHEWSVQGSSWPVDGDPTGLSRRVEWLVKNAIASGSLRLGLVLQHEMEPFTLKVHLNGRLKGENHKWFLFHRLANRENVIPVKVTPSDGHRLQLDDTASRLNEAMTMASIDNYLRNSHISIKAEKPRVKHTTVCEEHKAQSPRDHPLQKGPREQKTSPYYTIAWVCALAVEMAAAKAMLDEVHLSLSTHPNDTNHYILGRIGPHNIVIACLPQGTYGTTSAAVVAARVSHTFRHIQLFLLVGIGGGVPSETADIRLGDVVVSCPTKQFGGVVQHDFGKYTDADFEITGMLNKPPPAALIAIARLRIEHLLGVSQIPRYLEEMLIRYPGMKSGFTHPGEEMDKLFKADYEHVRSAPTCQDCHDSKAIGRPPRALNSSSIHYGIIASGNQLMKHAMTRDRLAQKFGILCFEMEAAGLLDNFPCLVIRGISDYADSHKNKRWQGYAAATAAAYAKELLLVTSVTCPDLRRG